MHPLINTNILRQELSKVINGSNKPLIDALKDLGIDVNQMRLDKITRVKQSQKELK